MMKYPKTIDEAVDEIISQMNDESKNNVTSLAEDELCQLFHSWGQAIRNAFGMWRGNDELIKSCGYNNPDDSSYEIMCRVREKLLKDKNK